MAVRTEAEPLILNAQHPAPIVHIPARARVPRLSFARTVTAVEVREVSFSELEPLDLLGMYGGPSLDERDHFLHDGSAWAAIGHDPTRMAGRNELAAVLEMREGIGEKYATNVLRQGLCQTPLTLSNDGKSRGMFDLGNGHLRGEILPTSKEVRHDGRQAAADHMRDFVDRNLMLVDGTTVYSRVVPYARIKRMDSALHAGCYVDIHDGRTPRDLYDIAARFSEIGAVEEILMGKRKGSLRVSESLEKLKGLPPSVLADGDLLVLANGVPGALRYRIDKDIPDGMASPHREAMRNLEIKALTWSIRGGEVEDALTRIAEAAEYLVSRRREGWGDRSTDHGVEALGRVVREVHLARIAREREVDLAEDSLALEAAAFGMG